MRKLIKNNRGFTLVELMVVVVVLGVLAGIAVQRMGDVRARAELAAERSNARLILGAANLAKVNNYVSAGSNFNYVIRWARPIEDNGAVNHWYGPSDGGYGWHPNSNYEETSNFNEGGTASPPSGDWDLDDYFEAFPVGYGVEIIFGTDAPTEFNPNDGTHPGLLGGDYDTDIIRVYRFDGTDAADPGSCREISPN